MKIAVLAVQGAFEEHRRIIEALGAECVELRQKEDLKEPFGGLILPGGESGNFSHRGRKHCGSEMRKSVWFGVSSGTGYGSTDP